MATTSVEKEIYPLSTEDNRSIPLDVIRPLSLLKGSIAATGATSITIPVGWKVASFFSNVGCFVQFAAASLPTPPTLDTPYADTLWVPPNFVVVSTVLEGTARVVSAEGVAGYLIAQHVQKWAGMALRRQISKV